MIETPIDDERDPLDAIADEFLERLRRGERPAISTYAARDSDRAGEIRELLSALLMVEDLKPRCDDTVGLIGRNAGASGPVPDRLGDFRILRELGRGGMGIVYEAEQESLGRHVALKVLSPAMTRSPQQIRRFLREARSAAQLHHTNIVPVFGVGEHDGLHYYAMQYIRGLGLDKVLDEVKRLKNDRAGVSELGIDPTQVGRSDPSARSVARSFVSGQPDPWLEDLEAVEADPEAAAAAVSVTGPGSLTTAGDSRRRYAAGVARIGLQVAEALDYAHQQGVMHRDIKPSNLLVDAQGTAWVTDFGLAKATEDEDLTRTGDIVGTLRYMAPERFKGRCDARSDVYALGLTLYELLALRPAFDASDRERLTYQVTHDLPPRLFGVDPTVPRDLATVVHKAIEHEPSHRYPTAAALAEDLRRFLEDRPIRARRVSPAERLARWARRNRGLATLGGILAVLLALMIVVIVVANISLRREHAQTVFNLRRAERAEADAVRRLLRSYIAQARASRHGGVIGRRFEGLRALADASELDAAAGSRLELRDEAIACMALPDLRPIRHWPGRPADGYVGVDLDPTNGRIARGLPDGSVEIRLEGGLGAPGPIRLPGNGIRAVAVRFGRDGRHLAVKHEGGGRLVLAVWDLTRRAKLIEVDDAMYWDALDFHPHEPTVAAGRRDGTVVLFDLETGAERGRLRSDTVPRVLRFDPSGRRVAVASPNARDGVQVIDVADGSITAGWPLPDPTYTLDWHPDGRRLAAGQEGGRIALLDAADPEARPTFLDGHEGATVALAFHPGGRLLASASWDGTLRLWDVAAARELLRGPLSEARSLRFSRDGRLLGTGHDGNASWIWELAEGVECRSLAGVDGAGARTWSIGFLERGALLVSAGAAGVRLEPLDPAGRPAFLELPGTVDAAATPDGSALITSGTTGLLRWPVNRPSDGGLSVGPPEPLGPLAGIPTGRLVLGPDGRTLAVVVDAERGAALIFDLERGGEPVKIEGHPGLERLALSPDGRWLATGTWRGTGVKIWDARTGSPVRDLPVAGSAAVLFSPDGRLLVTGSGTEYVLWDPETWRVRRRFHRSQAGGLPGSAAFGPDGRTLALLETRRRVRLHEVETGRELATFEPPDARAISGVGFSPDGRSLVLTFNAAAIQVWDLDAIQRGLAALRLDWPDPARGGEPPGGPPGLIRVEPAPWLEPWERGEELARAGRWDEAAAAFDEAIAAGADHVDAWMRRALFRHARGDAAGYREACRRIDRGFEAADLIPTAANNLAWSCALGPDALDDYERAIRLTQMSAASLAVPNRLNTLGAVLYRAGRLEEAIAQFERAVAAHGAGGTPYDALFLAMAHHRLGRREQALEWYHRGAAPIASALRKPDAVGDTSWIPQLELEALGREAAALIDPTGRLNEGGVP